MIRSLFGDPMGGDKDTGGIIAQTTIESDVYEQDDESKVDLNIHSYRLNQENGMLMRHHLKEIPDTKMLKIFKMSQATNYLLTKKEYDCILNLWNHPELVDERLHSSIIDNYLHIFKKETEDYLQNNPFLQDSYQFFRNFTTSSNLEVMEWEDIQK